jgi:hypothetical protein
MEAFIENWWKEINLAPLWGQLVLQSYLYGVFSLIQESQEDGKWNVFTYKEAIEEADEFLDFPNDFLESLHKSVESLFEGALPTIEEYNRYISDIIDNAENTLEICVMSKLFSGECLTDEDYDDLLSRLSFRPDERQRKRPMTRRVRGRRAITPIRRRGYRTRARL